MPARRCRRTRRSASSKVLCICRRIWASGWCRSSGRAVDLHPRVVAAGSQDRNRAFDRSGRDEGRKLSCRRRLKGPCPVRWTKLPAKAGSRNWNAIDPGGAVLALVFRGFADREPRSGLSRTLSQIRHAGAGLDRTGRPCALRRNIASSERFKPDDTARRPAFRPVYAGEHNGNAGPDQNDTAARHDLD
jgi:hypothetical protein